MKRLAIGFLLLAAVVGTTAPAQAQRIALHVRSFTSSKICGASAPAGACDTFVNTMPAGTSAAPIQYTVYISAVMDTVTTAAGGGLSGCGFGIQYEPYMNNGGTKSGLLVNSFLLCANLQFPAALWPATNTGNVVTWSSCQKGTSLANNVQALVGALQVTSYSPTKLYIIRRPANNRLEITGCPISSPPNFDIPDNKVGFIAFAGASESGCNPCAVSECIGVATKPTTWSKIKTTFGGE